MSLPITSDKNQAGCTPISSNCVIWQGPDIDCINLCRGDSISDVTAKLATELCQILDWVDVDTFDLTCFNPVCPTMENIHDLIQFLIDKLCALNECCTNVATAASSITSSLASRPAGTACPDCLVTVSPCFYIVNSSGDTITQMQLTEYARTIGARICTIIGEITDINTTLAQQQAQINYILLNYAPVAPVVLPTFTSTCLTDKIPVIPPGGILLSDMIIAMQAALCDLRAALGTPASIITSVTRVCTKLDTSPTLNLPGVNMGSLPGWVQSGSYATLADSVNNMWITICDLRAAVNTILTTCCPAGCAGLVVDLQVVYVPSSTIKFFWAGTGAGFTDCDPNGSLATITDSYGNSYTTRVSIIPYLNSVFAVNLGGTPVNTNTNLTISVDACFTKNDGTTCERVIVKNINNIMPCPTLNLDVDTNTVTYQFDNALAGTVTYGIKLYQSNTLIDSHVTVTPAPGSISGTFDVGIFPSTVYSVILTITIGGVLVNTCPTGIITTLPLSCNPPTNISAITA